MNLLLYKVDIDTPKVKLGEVVTGKPNTEYHIWVGGEDWELLKKHPHENSYDIANLEIQMLPIINPINIAEIQINGQRQMI